jgi:hypothetical protein
MSDAMLIFDNSGADVLTDAIVDAPLSDSLKRLFLSELFDSPLLHKGPAGVSYFPGATAGETGQVRVVTKLGRAGVALTAAFRALRAATLDEVGNGRHESPSPEITPEMIPTREPLALARRRAPLKMER